MIHGERNFNFSIQQDNSICKATVTVAANYVDALYNQALLAQKAEAHTYGFSKGETPLHYIEHNFKPNLVSHLKELFFTHCVMNILWQSLYTHKIVIIGEPYLTHIFLQPHQDAEFVFSFMCINTDKEERWKKLTLRAPERKNYKDLDRQVESFMKEELERLGQIPGSEICINDWVCFDIILVDEINQPLLKNYKDRLWVKINDEEADRELHSLFLGKKKGDSFLSNNPFLQEYISNEFEMNYTFLVEIIDIIPHAYFSFDQFRRHFQLKTPKDTHQKLIEVFSYRNDLSQRRETVEATLKLLLKHYFIPIPQTLLERQKTTVLSKVHTNPDYHVYKAQNDFKEKIKLLAEKQLKEAIVIDSIAYQENIAVNHDDIAGYINLIKRPRTKEFVYFDIPTSRLKGQEAPLANEIVKQFCLREKTLNHVICQLTKKI